MWKITFQTRPPRSLSCRHSRKLPVHAVSLLLSLLQSLAVYGIRVSISPSPNPPEAQALATTVGMAGVLLVCQWPHLFFVGLAHLHSRICTRGAVLASRLVFVYTFWEQSMHSSMFFEVLRSRRHFIPHFPNL